MLAALIMAMMISHTLTISIDAPPKKVYTFVSNPANFSKFAAFVRSVSHRNGEWFLETDDGSMKIRFVPQNDLGVLDHTVTLPSGVEILNPMRVIPNGDGSEVTFTLFRRPDVTANAFAGDAKLVEEDLKTLKSLLEKRAAR